MLEIQKLDYAFGKKQVLNQFTFTFEAGIYGLLGPNGAGKTTLLRCLTKIYPVAGDAMRYQGRPIARDEQFATHVGYLPQKFGMFKELRVRDMLGLMANLKGLERREANKQIEQSVEFVNLSDRMDSKVGTLSGGMIRRLGIAQAMLGEPEILIFDEPTAGLDPEERLRFKNIVSELRDGRTILLSTHIVEDVEALCDTVAVMKDGRIAASGSCKEIQDLACGKVYEVQESGLGQITGPYHVQKHLERNGTRLLKVLCSEVQPELAAAVPTVEDGYICVLKGV